MATFTEVKIKIKESNTPKGKEVLITNGLGCCISLSESIHGLKTVDCFLDLLSESLETKNEKESNCTIADVSNSACISRDKCTHGSYCKNTDPDKCMDWEAS